MCLETQVLLSYYKFSYRIQNPLQNLSKSGKISVFAGGWGGGGAGGGGLISVLERGDFSLNVHMNVYECKCIICVCT